MLERIQQYPSVMPKHHAGRRGQLKMVGINRCIVSAKCTSSRKISRACATFIVSASYQDAQGRAVRKVSLEDVANSPGALPINAALGRCWQNRLHSGPGVLVGAGTIRTGWSVHGHRRAGAILARYAAHASTTGAEAC